MNPRQALYYGLIPSLIFLGNKGELGLHKCRDALLKCLDEGLVTVDNGVRLLKSFFTGQASLVPRPLLEYMNTVEEGKVRWIPFHMLEVIRVLADHASLPSQSVILRGIVSLFDRFCSAKGQSGDAWEALFVVVLLLRAVTQQFDSTIFPLQHLSSCECSVSFNDPLDLHGKAFELYSVVDELVTSIIAPAHFPHVAVYFPTHASFEEVDVIVAVWQNASCKELYGYQLKEGKEQPKIEAHVAFMKSFVIRGVAAMKASKIRNWHLASVEEIDAFFGESGSHWTPEAWKQLSAK